MAQHDGGARREERQEVRGETEESVVNINERAERPRDPGFGSQEAIRTRARPPSIRNQVRQREQIIERGILRAAAVCLTLLCTLFVVRATDKALDYANNQLPINDKNLTLERDLLRMEVNKLKKDIAALCLVKSCPSGWKKFGCSCYYSSAERNIWKESRKQCLETGGDLVVINNEEEQEFIKGLVPEGRRWIGLKRTEGNWTWVDGTPLTSGYWASGWPHHDIENWNCAEYWNGDGKWTNLPCTSSKACICEK